MVVRSPGAGVRRDEFSRFAGLAAVIVSQARARVGTPPDRSKVEPDERCGGDDESEDQFHHRVLLEPGITCLLGRSGYENCTLLRVTCQEV